MFKKRKPTTFNVKVFVKTFDSDLSFSVAKNVTGQFLFDQVCSCLGLREVWYFGLQYTDSKSNTCWLRLNKKLCKQDINTSKCVFLFCAKFYPENVTEDLIQDITKHYFYLQTKQAILNMDIYCPPEASVLLASYAVQAQYGDYDEATYTPGTFTSHDLLPSKVIEQYHMTPDMWEERIRQWYTDHKGMTRDEAQMEYLKIAQDLQMYGVNYFLIKNKKLTDCWLGITALGLNIYERENQLSPVTTFQWNEIKNISFDDKKFTVKLVKSDQVPFIFFSEKNKINKVILDLCMGNHDLYIKRRGPESMEIQQMKAFAKEEKQRRQIERNQLVKEKQLREAAEREKRLLEEKVFKLEAEIALTKKELCRSEETAELLAEKNRVAEEEALLLLHKNSEVEQKISKIIIINKQTEEEKLGLEKRTKNAEMLSKERSIEADRLKNELVRAKVAEKEAKEKLLSYLSQSLQICEDMEERDSKLSFIPMDPYPDMDHLSFEIEREKVQYLSKSKHIESQLQELRSEIELLKIMEKQCPLDIINSEQRKSGENKYSTLRKLKLGTAKSRVAFFEDL